MDVNKDNWIDITSDNSLEDFRPSQLMKPGEATIKVYGQVVTVRWQPYKLYHGGNIYWRGEFVPLGDSDKPLCFEVDITFDPTGSRDTCEHAHWRVEGVTYRPTNGTRIYRGLNVPLAIALVACLANHAPDPSGLVAHVVPYGQYDNYYAVYPR